MTARVALFRAREDAARAAARLRRLGFAVANLPVIEIAPRPFAPSRTRYDAVVATSAKAFLSDAPVEKASPLFVVGARTARAAESRGWRLAAPPAPDAARLIEALKRLTAPGASVLYLAGRDRKGALEAALGATRALEIVEAYAAEAREAWSRAEVRALAACEAAAALFRAIGRACGSTGGRGRTLRALCGDGARLPVRGCRRAAQGDWGRPTSSSPGRRTRLRCLRL